MTRPQWIVTAFCFFFTFSAVARADVWNKKTHVTLRDTIAVSDVVLDPGNYVMKLMDSMSNRHIVQISNERENHVHATILAIPAYRMQPTDKTVFTFREIPGQRVQALKEWYYPGDTIGQEFPAPKRPIMELARSFAAPPVVEPESEALPETPTPEPTPEPEAAPRPEPKAEVSEPEAAPAPEADDPEAQSPPPAQEKPSPTSAESAKPEQKMPETASSVWMVLITGMGLFSAAIVVRKLAELS